MKRRLQMLLFGAVSVFMLAGAVVWWQEYRVLRSRGVETDARVTDVFGKWIEVDFGTADGRRVHADVHRYDADRPVTGGTIRVLYDPEDPEFSVVGARTGPSLADTWIFLGFAVLSGAAVVVLARGRVR